MGYIYIGEKGTKLKDILNQFYDQDFDVIECRMIYEHNGKEYDILTGFCSYINGELKSLDHDTYSIDDLYVKWEAWLNDEGHQCLTVWEDGRWSEEWED